jgi:hypothetical protein
MDGEEVQSFQSEESMAMAILRSYADELGVSLD